MIPEGPGAPPEMCRCAPVKGSTGVDVNLQYSIRIISDAPNILHNATHASMGTECHSLP